MSSVTGYGLDLTTMAQTNLLKRDRVQNEAMQVILGTTRDTPTETVKFMLDLPPLEPRQKMEQVKAYSSAVENPHNTLSEAVKDTTWRGLGEGKSWMGQAEDSLLQAGKTESQIRILVRQNSKPQDLIVYTNGSTVTKRLIRVGLHY